MPENQIVWTDYMKYRLNLRGYDLAKVEQILRYSSERYVDSVTGRLVVVGRHENLLVMIPYDLKKNAMTPVTVHNESAANQFSYKIGEIYQ